MSRFLRLAPVAFLVIALAAQICAGDEGVAILDMSSFWRFHYSLGMPVVRQGEGLKRLNEAFAKDWKGLGADRNAKWLEYDTALPAAGWTGPEFDDHTWLRMPGQPLAKTYQRGGGGFGYQDSPYMALLSMRGRFRVDDPAKVTGLALSLGYSGGVVVYVNGKELCRGNLPAGKLTNETVAEAYAAGGARTRTLSAVPVPATLLGKGVNVLAVEVHRAPYAESEFQVPGRDNWRRVFNLAPGTCAVKSIRLEAAAGSAIVPNVGRPAGIQVWNSDVLAPDFDLDYGDANEPLRPVEIVGAPNGAFSGKVVVGSDAPIRGLKGTMSELKQAQGTGRIPASAVQVRYASAGLVAGVGNSIDIVHLYGGTEVGAEARYLAEPDRFDILNEAAPAEVPVYEKKPVKGCLSSAGVTASFGAVAPVWVTVHVPAETAAGEYVGTLTITTAGHAPIAVPVRVRVADWRVPDPKDFRTFVELIESPESVALYYDVPFWSEAHFKYLEKSMALVGGIGTRTVYIPLICETNMGNSQTMVRWIKGADGTFTYDFSVLDRYLDLVQKYEPKPQVVCFVVWDFFLHSENAGGDFDTEEAKQYRGGPEVTAVDPDSGQTSKLKLPAYGDPAATEAWKPVFAEIRSRMKKRGMESAMILGLASDRVPDPGTVEFFKEMLPGASWVSFSHQFPGKNTGIPFGYQANVFEESPVLDPSVGRQYGWMRPNLVQGGHFPRLTQDIFPLATFRFLSEMNVGSNYRGVSRLGADLWPVLKDKKGNRVGRIAARYSKSAWWNLNIITSLVAPGPEGAVATVRYEVLRQGVQECEARIFIERALTDKNLRAKLGEPLATRCQELLDARTRDMLRAVSTLIQTDDSWANWATAWWQFPGVIGGQYYLSTDHAQSTADLFNAAADVQKALAAP